MSFLSPRTGWLVLFIHVALGLGAADTDLVLRSTVVPVGTRGATLVFPAGWGRQVLNGQLGPDQFRRADAEEFLVLVEVPGFLVSEDALKETLSLREKAIRAENPQATTRSLDPQRTPVSLFVRDRMDLKVTSLELSYVVGVVGIPGARYFVMAWSYPKNFGTLLRDVDSIVATLRGDPGSPEYSQRTKTVPVSVTGAGTAVVLRYPEAVYSARTARSPVLVKLYGREEDLTVTVQTGPWPGDGEAGDITVGTEGKVGTFESRFAPPEPGEEGNRLEVRLSSQATEGLVLRIEGPLGREGLTVAARDLLARMTVETGDFQEALPPQPEQAEVETRKPLLSLASASTREGVVPDQIRDFFWASDGRPWALTSQGAGTFSGATWQSRARWEAGPPKGPAAVGSVTFFVALEGQPVSAYLGSGFQPQAWTADALVAGRGQSGVGLLRSTGSPEWDLPFGGGPGQFQTLWLRSDRGGETSLGSFPQVREAAFDGGGTQVLLETEHPASAVTGRSLRTLVRVSADLTRHPAGSWTSVDTLVPADGGWLVQGSPEGQSEGTWFLGTDGDLRILVGDLGLTPLGLRAGRLWYAFPRNWEVRGVEWKVRSVYSVALSELDAPRFPGYSGEALNRAGQAVGLGTGYPSLPTRESALALVAAVRTALSTQTGLPFPPDPRFFDTLPGVSGLAGALGPGGFRALTILLAGSFLDSGAEWVDSRTPDDGFQPPAREVDSTFSRSLFLPAVVYSTLYEDEGWYEPVSTVLQDREGKVLLVGLDPSALDRRQKETLEPELGDLLADQDKAPLGRWLMEPSRQGNEGLRQFVLRTLWRQGDFRGLATVLGTLGDSAGGQGVLMGHLLKWQAGGFVLDGPGAFKAVFGLDPGAMIDDLKALVAATDREPMAVYFLGKAWEFSPFPYGRFNARQCYQTLEGNYRVSEALKARLTLDLARLADPPND